MKEFFFGKFLETLTPAHVFLKDFYYNSAHKPYIAVIFENIFIHRTLSMAVCFCYKLKDKIKARSSK